MNRVETPEGRSVEKYVRDAVLLSYANCVAKLLQKDCRAAYAIGKEKGASCKSCRARCSHALLHACGS